MISTANTSAPGKAPAAGAELQQLLREVDRELVRQSDSDESSHWDYFSAFSRHAGLLTHKEQEVLCASRIAIVGMGGVGGIHAVTLARLGVGKFTIADPDCFELANMNRQHGARLDTLGRQKAEVMADEIRRINPDADVRVISEAIRAETVSDFLADADLFVDAIDFFALEMRRRLFRQAVENGIHSITAAPVGFSTGWLVFSPDGMGFDEYFDLHDRQTELEKLIAFVVGVTPALLQRPYIDVRCVDLAEGRGPSAALACQLCAGVVAAEAVKILLTRGNVRCAPCYSQFDAYRGILRQGRLRWGNRGPLQRLKRLWLTRYLAAAQREQGLA